MLADIAEEVKHPTAGAGPFIVNVDTLKNTAIVCGIFLVLAVILRAKMSAGRPGGLQNVVEGLIDFINGLVRDTLGTRPIRIVPPLAITMFSFVVISNWLGLVPTLKSPTNDVNTCFALAVVTVLLLHSQSIRARGPGGYVAHYFGVITPRWTSGFGLGGVARILFGILEILQEFAKPLTLSFRLYFNIFVGELMLGLIIELAKYLATLGVFGGVGSVIVAGTVGVVWILFSIFVGAVQAYILTMLTVSYVAQGTETHDDHADTTPHAEPPAAARLAAA